MVTSDLSDCTRALKLAKLSSIPRPGNEKEGVTCPSCGLGGLTAAQLFAHYSLMHVTEPSPNATCPLCNVVCSEAASDPAPMAMHCTEMESDTPSPEVPAEESRDACADCDLKAASNFEAAASERPDFDRNERTDVQANVVAQTSTDPRARQTKPRSGAPPPRPLAIRHAPLLI